MRDEHLTRALLDEALLEADELLGGLDAAERQKYEQEACVLRKKTFARLQTHGKSARSKRIGWRMIAVAALLSLILCGAGIALSDIPVRFWDDQSVIDGIVNRKEIYEATCVADFRWNDAGDLEMYQFVMRNPRGVQDDAYGNGEQQPAATWTGKIAYVQYKTAVRDANGALEAAVSYVPVSFAQSVEVYDDDIVLQELCIEGGACGTAYDINDGLRRCTVALSTEPWYVKNPNSGAWYQQAFDNPGYAFSKADTEAQVCTVGAIRYSAADDPSGAVRQTQPCRMELLDWWLP